MLSTPTGDKFTLLQYFHIL